MGCQQCRCGPAPRRSRLPRESGSGAEFPCSRPACMPRSPGRLLTSLPRFTGWKRPRPSRDRRLPGCASRQPGRAKAVAPDAIHVVVGVEVAHQLQQLLRGNGSGRRVQPARQGQLLAGRDFAFDVKLRGGFSPTSTAASPGAHPARRVCGSLPLIPQRSGRGFSGRPGGVRSCTENSTGKVAGSGQRRLVGLFHELQF